MDMMHGFVVLQQINRQALANVVATESMRERELFRALAREESRLRRRTRLAWIASAKAALAGLVTIPTRPASFECA